MELTKMDLSQLTIDPKAVEEGEWVDNLPECEDLRILSKGINCVAAKRMLNAKIRSLPRHERTPQVPPEIMERLTLETVIEVCLKGWENLTFGKKPVPYSLEKAREIGKDRRYEPLHNAFLIAANRVGDARTVEVEETVKN